MLLPISFFLFSDFTQLFLRYSLSMLSLSPIFRYRLFFLLRNVRPYQFDFAFTSHLCSYFRRFLCYNLNMTLNFFPHSLHRNIYTVYTLNFRFFDSYSLHRNFNVSFSRYILPALIINRFSTRIPCIGLT